MLKYDSSAWEVQRKSRPLVFKRYLQVSPPFYLAFSEREQILDYAQSETRHCAEPILPNYIAA